MTFVGKAGISLLILGLLGTVGYGIKFVFDYVSPYTLDYVMEYRPGGSRAARFGGQFSKHLLSTDEAHREHNRPYWKNKVRKLALSGGVVEESYLENTYTLAKDPEQHDAAVDDLIRECKDVYSQATIAVPKDDKDKTKWTEIWTYCSVDGEESWIKPDKKSN